MKRRMRWMVAGLLVAVLALIGVGLWYGRSGETAVRTATATRQDIIQEVTATGRLEATEQAHLGFELSGTVTEVATTIGEHVVAGQTLIRLDGRLAQLEAAQARASRASGQTAAELVWKHAAETEKDTTVTHKRTLERLRQAVRDRKQEWDQSQSIWQQSVRESGDEASAIQARYATVVAAESAYRAAQETLREGIASAAAAEHAAAHATAQAHADWQATLHTAPGVAGLSTLEATEALAGVRLAKTVLTAPFDGVVTALEVSLGELATAGSPVATIETVGALRIVSQLPETDAAKLQSGLAATVTFDADSAAHAWPALITTIAPSAVVIEGVPTYEVTLQLQEATSTTLKPGLTANITIEAQRRPSVVAIPRRAAVTQGGRQFVRVREADGSVREQDVTLGILGSDGNIEVVAGLTEGTIVLTEPVAE